MLICHCNLITEKEIEQTIIWSCSMPTLAAHRAGQGVSPPCRNEAAVAAASQMWWKRSFG
jgi:bacterioferritin-associated ferredoxin